MLNSKLGRKILEGKTHGITRKNLQLEESYLIVKYYAHHKSAFHLRAYQRWAFDRHVTPSG